MSCFEGICLTAYAKLLHFKGLQLGLKQNIQPWLSIDSRASCCFSVLKDGFYLRRACTASIRCHFFPPAKMAAITGL